LRAWGDLVGKVFRNCKSLLAAPPLTLTLSPLRGEGTRNAPMLRALLASWPRLGLRLKFGAWNLFGVWCLGFGVLSANPFSLSHNSSRKVTEPF
jgi:hypothetical protein